MRNYLQLEIGGKLRGLKFNMGTYQAISDLTGQDPLTFAPASNAYADLVPYARTIFHAALLSNCKSKKEEPDFTQADVDAWFDEFGIKDVTLIINMHTGVQDNSPSVNGEADKDTQHALVAGT